MEAMEASARLQVRPPVAEFLRTSALVSLTGAVATAALTGYGWIAVLEGLQPPWILARTMSLGIAATEGAVLAALIGAGLAARGLVKFLAWAALLYGLPIASGAAWDAHALEPIVTITVADVLVAATVLGALAVRIFWRRWSGGHAVRRREALQVGGGLVLLAGLWVAAVRVGALHQVRLTGNVDAVVFTPVVLVSLGLTALTWHGFWRAVSPPKQTVPASELIALGRSTRRAVPRRVALARLSDVVLPKETKAELRVLIRLITNPGAGRELGVKTPPPGAILYGPPGTGKTLVARAIAGECGRPVLAFDGAAITSMWMGEGTQLVADMFDQARGAAPCVLFIDELDGIVPRRGAGGSGIASAGHDATQRINQFLQELEGVGGGLRNVCVIGATNLLEAIDPAVLDRLSYHVQLPLPNRDARVAMLEQHWPARCATTPEAVADLTAGLSMRANRDLCEIAGMVALSENAREVKLEHFRRAIGRMHRTDV